MSGQEPILLQTKLHRPRLPSGLVRRSRRAERLNHEIDHQLILVCAPAGFGKTTLIGAWLDRMAAGKDETAVSLPSAWNESSSPQCSHPAASTPRTTSRR